MNDQLFALYPSLDEQIATFAPHLQGVAFADENPIIGAVELALVGVSPETIATGMICGLVPFQRKQLAINAHPCLSEEQARNLCMFTYKDGKPVTAIIGDQLMDIVDGDFDGIVTGVSQNKSKLHTAESLAYEEYMIEISNREAELEDGASVEGEEELVVVPPASPIEGNIECVTNGLMVNTFFVVVGDEGNDVYIDMLRLNITRSDDVIRITGVARDINGLMVPAIQTVYQSIDVRGLKLPLTQINIVQLVEKDIAGNNITFEKQVFKPYLDLNVNTNAIGIARYDIYIAKADATTSFSDAVYKHVMDIDAKEFQSDFGPVFRFSSTQLATDKDGAPKSITRDDGIRGCIFEGNLSTGFITNAGKDSTLKVVNFSKLVFMPWGEEHDKYNEETRAEQRLARLSNLAEILAKWPAEPDFNEIPMPEADKDELKKLYTVARERLLTEAALNAEEPVTETEEGTEASPEVKADVIVQ